ncbi:MAG: 6,7-dimethyl-8-ribityllumazine synthase [Cyclobacteriaceae bacterium]|nr:6,7-dimethyl-8-ribityllumazine synthase [Cyclobacteriaceae bacterium]
MSTSEKNLSAQAISNKMNVREKKFGLVVSEWNEEVTEALFEAAYQTLIDHGAIRENIFRKNVPGSFELSLGAQWLAQSENIDAVICLGCVIQGETRHFEFICQSVAQGIKDVALKYNKPVIFGVLTTDTKQQALDRAGGKHGNKGDEAAVTAIKMLNF